MSLLHKKYGFIAFAQETRDDYVLAGRNLAKFIQASNAFALGRNKNTSAHVNYMDAANNRNNDEILRHHRGGKAIS